MPDGTISRVDYITEADGSSIETYWVYKKISNLAFASDEYVEIS